MQQDEEIIEEEGWPSPLKIIIGIFLVIIVILMIIPIYSVKLDPEPRDIPSIQDVLPQGVQVQKIDSSDFKDFVMPTDPGIKQVATKVATESCNGNKICQAKALYYFVRDNVEYVADPVGSEYWESGIEVLNSGGGDCESGSLLLASLEEAIGVDSQIVLVTGHAYLRIRLPEALKKYKLDGDWIYLDWTCESCEFGEVPWQTLSKGARYVEVP